MSIGAPTLSASKWNKAKSGWVVPRPIYEVWWLSKTNSYTSVYVVADSRAVAIRKAKKRWAKLIGSNVGAKIIMPKGLKRAPYAPPKVHLK